MSSSRPAAVVVLAAGEGTRMRSATPKVLHTIAGRTLIAHAVAAASSLDPEHLVVVVRHGRDAVVAHLAKVAPDAVVADQDDQPGTGRAALCGLQALPPLRGTVVVTYGDVPLLTGATLARVVAAHEQSGDAITVLTTWPADPGAYGRIVRDGSGSVVAIVERRDATDEQAAIAETNTGIYAFDGEFLSKALERIGTGNAQGEVYLTDTVALARADGLTVGSVPLADPVEADGVNDRVELARLGRALRDRIVEGWMRSGVTVIDPQTTWIDSDAELAQDVTLLPGAQIFGHTRLAAGSSVGPDATLVDTEIGEGASVVRSQVTGAVIGPGAAVGPFAYLRPGTRLGAGGRIGAYVETKNAVIGAGSKVPHLSYVGDADIGEGTNIGAGDDLRQLRRRRQAPHRGRRPRPGRVGHDARGTGDDRRRCLYRRGFGDHRGRPPGAMAVGRARQRNIDGWVERKRAGSSSAKAASSAKQARQQADATEGQGQ